MNRWWAFIRLSVHYWWMHHAYRIGWDEDDRICLLKCLTCGKTFLDSQSRRPAE